MHKDSKKLMDDVIGKVRQLDPSTRAEDGSVEISIDDDDIKTILGKKVLRSNTKERLSTDLKEAGLEAKVCPTNDMKVIIPKDKIECKTIKYSELTQSKGD